ncbi:Translation initiation factor IF-2 like [Actinidia chinensis var. chinensis]|uniref:Translation initiation factor IF-2 like n=1 Tax=Actinidia chinensis var. chinensis TaxID=1590841 RepID=A0A2R6RSQ3_ACTCC|nr:Translation initiation factor IF-2 like [Actinidia chinensis var. chinensis]
MPLVDSMGPPSASMLNTVNLELSKFIIPELTWKTVTKGFRSAPRRSRKPAKSMNMGVQEDGKSTNRGESSVSESEKLGVAVLGRRFSDNIESVPIKKRRLLFQSTSLRPQTPSPHYEESLSSQLWTCSPQPEDFDLTIESKCVSGQWWCSDSVANQEMGAFNASVEVQSSRGAFVNEKLSEVTNRKLEDFSGIALLAAAACNNSISDDAHNVKEGPVRDVFFTSGADSSISVAPLERTITSSESGNLFLRERHEDNIDGLMTQDTSATMSPNLNHKRDSETGNRSSSMKDGRLHWDLNTVMEAWELPCDDLNIGSQGNSSESIPDDGVRSEKPEKFEGCVRHKDPEHASEFLKYSNAKTEVFTEVICKDKELDSSPSTVSNPISSGPHCNEKMNTSPTNVVIQTRESWFGVPALQVGQALSMLDPAVSDKVVCEIDNIQSKEDSKNTFHLPDSWTSPTHLACTVTCQMLDVIDYSVCKKSGPFHSSAEHENLSALGTTSGGGQHVDVGEKQDMELSPAIATVMDSLLHVDKELVSKSCTCFGEVALDDPIVDACGLDTSHGDHGHTACCEKMTQIQADYESPFEDGELRESIVRFCEENEVEGQTECVDYDSDYRDGDNFDATNQCMPEVGPDSLQNGNNGNLKESSNSVSLKMFPGQGQLAEGCEHSYYLTGEANNVSTQKILASDSMCGLDVEGTSAGEVGSRVTGEKLVFHIEGLSSSDALYGKDNVYMQHGRSSYRSSGRVIGSEKFLNRDRLALPMQDRSQGDAHWIDSPADYWDSRNRYQTGYQQGTGHPRTRRVIANSAAKIDGSTYHDQRRIMTYSSKGVYRPLIRRRSPAESDDGYSVPRRPVAARGNGYITNRGRSRPYRQEFNRRPREGHHGPMSENPASSSGRLPHYLARRERSFSPILHRGANFSRSQGNSRSRSRTRSPVMRHLQRERNEAVRRFSRSPDFRSEARMERVRMSNYAADNEDVFMSPPRTRFSPQRHSRLIDDRNFVDAHFRERKPPGRLFGLNQKFDSGVSPGRMKPDDCFKSKIRHGRFTQLFGGDGRGHKYGGNDCERTKYRDKYETSHGVRRDTSGVIRRPCHDVEDCFEVHNTHDEDNYIKGTDRRDIPRSTRGPFRYSNERNSRLSEIRDYNEDASPSRG